MYALVGHVLVATAAFVVIVMYLPVISGEVSGEGAGMGVFLMLYFLGIPLGLGAIATAFFSIHSPNPGLLLPTIFFFIGIPVSTMFQSNEAFVVALGIYIAAVLRAFVLRTVKEFQGGS